MQIAKTMMVQRPSSRWLLFISPADIGGGGVCERFLLLQPGQECDQRSAIAQPNRICEALRAIGLRSANMQILWLIIIGFVAGIIAKFLHPGSSNEPSGFILTTLLGIGGSFVATYLGQALGWYQAGEGAGLIGAVVGAIVVLVIWGFFARRQSTIT
jgi:uncharacterized membrane protein YeaQ/YmgE (transglycosylase-associated protein family)